MLAHPAKLFGTRVPRRLSFLAIALCVAFVQRATADSTAQPLPFSQDWTNTELITVDNNWSGVPGIEGSRGTGLVTNVGVDPRMVLLPDISAPHVVANRVDLATVTALNLGIVELEGANPVVALQPAAGVRAPNLRINITTLGRSDVVVSYNVRDLDASVDNAIQQVVLQYRIGSAADCTGLTGNFSNIRLALGIEDGYIADATTGPSQATLVTPVSVILPDDANNQPCVQLRIMTTDYGVPMPPPGTTNNDEWIGIDDIRIESAAMPTDRTIHDIQGSGAVSPFVGERVRTTGIVTGIRTLDSGFFIQTPDAEIDGDPITSEGLLISGPADPSLSRGDLVEVVGFVSESPTGAPEGRHVTHIAASRTVEVLSTGNPLPAPVTLTAADAAPDGPLDALEKYEGMRVRVPSLVGVGPTEGTVVDAEATATSTGVFFGVIGDTPRPMREPGLDPFEPEPPGLPACVPPNPCVPRFDGNPERIRVDSDAQVGAGALDLAVGDIVSDLVGPLTYEFDAFTIAPDPGAPRTSERVFAPVSAPGPRQFTVGSFDLQRLYDTADDPATTDVVMTGAGLDRRLSKLSLLVRNGLQAPDILGVSAVENADVLQALADRINFDAIGAGEASPAYLAYLLEGSDPGGIDVGFLVRSTRMQVRDVTQGDVGTFVDPTDGSVDPLNDRPSLILRAVFTGSEGAEFPVTVIANHLESLNDIADPLAGPRVREKRRAQAEFLATLVQARQLADPNERIVVLGNMNAFEFNDGLVDSVGTIVGMPTPASAVLLSSLDLVNPDLVDAGSFLTIGERYSVVSEGNAQQFDHLLFTQNLTSNFARLEFGRVNADFPETFRSDPNRAERSSDHDPLVAFFTLPLPLPALTIEDVSVDEHDRFARVKVKLPAPSTEPITVRFRTDDGTATDGVGEPKADYVAASGTLVFNPGDVSRTIKIAIVKDHRDESAETFSVNLFEPTNATIDDDQGIVTIRDDDRRPRIRISNAREEEPRSGTALMKFCVELSAPSGRPVSVDFRTLNLSAVAGRDYVARTGTLTFAPGETRKSIGITILADDRHEHDEAFAVKLSNLVHARPGDTFAIGTIEKRWKRRGS
jgi:predicted extracellular nuclease